MTRNLLAAMGVLPVVVIFLLSSCGKEFSSKGFFNPLIGGCQVAEYHNPQFDSYFPTKPPYLFRKTFDASGRIVKEMACGFSNDNPPLSLPEFLLDVTIAQKDRRVFLLRAYSGKPVVPDTLLTIYLNWEGRPDSSIGRPGSDPEAGTAYEWEYYYYKGDRLQSINHTTFHGPHGGEGGYSFSGTDTIHYDKYGNPLSYGYNTYTYDYTRKGGQKFYLDVFMGNEANFYLLQYLGFFPEINNPPNLRTYEYNSDAAESLSFLDQQFDAQGKLTGIGQPDGGISITWNCSR